MHLALTVWYGGHQQIKLISLLLFCCDRAGAGPWHTTTSSASRPRSRASKRCKSQPCYLVVPSNSILNPRSPSLMRSKPSLRAQGPYRQQSHRLPHCCRPDAVTLDSVSHGLHTILEFCALDGAALTDVSTHPQNAVRKPDRIGGRVRGVGNPPIPVRKYSQEMS